MLLFNILKPETLLGPSLQASTLFEHRVSKIGSFDDVFRTLVEVEMGGDWIDEGDRCGW